MSPATLGISVRRGIRKFRTKVADFPYIGGGLRFHDPAQQRGGRRPEHLLGATQRALEPELEPDLEPELEPERRFELLTCALRGSSAKSR